MLWSPATCSWSSWASTANPVLRSTPDCWAGRRRSDSPASTRSPELGGDSLAGRPVAAVARSRRPAGAGSGWPPPAGPGSPVRPTAPATVATGEPAGRVANRSEVVTGSTIGLPFSAPRRAPTKAGSSDQPDGAMTATMRGVVSLGFSK